MDFKLQSGDTEFNTRVDALFSSLQSVAVELEPQESQEPLGPQGNKRHLEEEASVDDIDDSDRVFSKPLGRPPRWQGLGSRRKRGSYGSRNSTPDYIKNPEKWTKYNMKDTKVLNNRENMQVGLELMKTLQSHKNEESSSIEQTDVSQAATSKIIFKKPHKSPALTDSCDIADEGQNEGSCVVADGLFSGTQKFRMQDYEVGKGKPKGKKRQINISERLIENDSDSVDNKSGKEVKLGHLTYEEEEEEPY